MRGARHEWVGRANVKWSCVPVLGLAAFLCAGCGPAEADGRRPVPAAPDAQAPTTGDDGVTAWSPADFALPARARARLAVDPKAFGSIEVVVGDDDALSVPVADGLIRDRSAPPAPGRPVPVSEACDGLSSLSATDQLRRLEQTPCSDAFVTQFVAEPMALIDGFALAVGSTTTSDRLWQAAYAAHTAGRFRFEPPILDQLIVRLESAVQDCTGSYRCRDWTTWILDPMREGGMYTCPDVRDLGEPALRATLPYGDYACAERMAAQLAIVASETTVRHLVDMARSHATGWARRNALRTLGRFAERGPTSPPGRAVIQTLGHEVATVAADTVASAGLESAVHDAIWLLDSFFHPYFDVQDALRATALDDTVDTTLRFRAIAAWSRLAWAKSHALPDVDLGFIERALAYADPWVRAQAAYTAERLTETQLPSTARRRIVEALDAALGQEDDLSARVYQARALDRLIGGDRAVEVQTAFERKALPRAATSGAVTLRTGLDEAELPYWLERLEDVQAAFGRLLNDADPVVDDPNPHWTVIVFSNRDDYRAYMQSFVGFGAHSGGLYIESKATLYTYQRSASESDYTLEELLQHELTHGLTGRFVFSGVWGDPGYHDEPKGWLDEGLAEVMAGLQPDADEPFPLREVPLRQLCDAGPARLNDMLTRRAGYDQAGTFDYASAWSLVYYLVHHEPDALSRIVASYRDGQYRLAEFEAISGLSLGALQADWHQAVDGWCARRVTAGRSVVRHFFEADSDASSTASARLGATSR